mmetsp:Transcript_30370/g.73857  ORF Transcript_30370/g.73857 Transcript_30370/m.73857 type:complete len:113 (-) Transcript_30370:296-634(-)|eukprot:CAMPEP_0113475462 /NCGR_PEP_ID=MMETSP0014_2-20120614/19133_1 /TAXON_ID=2857 /ORGANISM="Nitzschia sp." /LENGTH=112 /DNA_ID=CAMNT_0000368383 /DNA_START=330 /DNA_END=668 /DNA_ORIENTATION=+ /assembly_acc=CAM_ASM_000159
MSPSKSQTLILAILVPLVAVLGASVEAASMVRGVSKREQGRRQLEDEIVEASDVPSDMPSLSPSLSPSQVPSDQPSLVPSSAPFVTEEETEEEEEEELDEPAREGKERKQQD